MLMDQLWRERLTRMKYFRVLSHISIESHDFSVVCCFLVDRAGPSSSSTLLLQIVFNYSIYCSIAQWLSQYFFLRRSLGSRIWRSNLDILFWSLFSSSLIIFCLPYEKRNNCANNQLIFIRLSEYRIMFMSINNLFYIQCPPFVLRENRTERAREQHKHAFSIQWTVLKFISSLTVQAWVKASANFKKEKKRMQNVILAKMLAIKISSFSVALVQVA